MKTPRVHDFDPNAKVPQLGSPMDNLPSIQLPDKKPESLNARKPENRKVPKYSTQLPEELQIEVSVFATRHHMADYEVIWKAIEEYLKKHT
jgi:hypothetical protein